MSEAVPEVPAEAPAEPVAPEVPAAPVEAVPVVAAQPSNAVVAEVVQAETVVRSFEDAVKNLVAVVETGEKLGARLLSEAVDEVKAHF